MTPFELELLKALWPWLWTGMLAIGGLYARTLIQHVYGQLSDLAATLQKFGSDLKQAEQEIRETREETRHRLDRLIGESDTRISRIEAVCETHGRLHNRRTGDSRQINWAQDSDVAGDPIKRGS